MTSLQATQHSVGTSGDFPREENDFYATPPSATRALLAAEQFDGLIWDPACGDGAILKVIHEQPNNRTHTIHSDLHYRGYYNAGGTDFLKTTKEDFDGYAKCGPVNIVTNPPFKLAREFIEHSLDLGAQKACFLLRLQFLEGQRRKPLLKRLARVHVFSKRIPRMHNPNYTGPKSTSLIAFAWFVWDRAHKGDPTLNWIDPI